MQADWNLAKRRGETELARIQSEADFREERREAGLRLWNRYGRWIIWIGAIVLALLAISYIVVLIVGFFYGVAPGTAKFGPPILTKDTDPLYFWFSFCFNLTFALLILALAVKCGVAAMRFRPKEI